MQKAFAAALLLVCSSGALAEESDCVDVVKLVGPEDTVVDQDQEKADKAHKRRKSAPAPDTDKSFRQMAAANTPGFGNLPKHAQIVAAMRQRALQLGGSEERTVGAAERARILHDGNVADLDRVARDYRHILDDASIGSCEFQEVKQSLRLALDYTRSTALAASQYGAQYGMYVGPNFSLGGKGEWQPGVETLVRFDTNVFTQADPDFDAMKWAVAEGGWLRGYTELSYQTINALEETENVATSTAPADSVFASAGGYARLNLGVQSHFTNWWGVQLGAGLSSLPNNDNVTRLEPRAFGGLHFQTIFNDGAVGQVFLGAAYDEFWQREVFNTPGDPLSGTHDEHSFGRFNIDGLLFLPGQAGNFHLAVRFFADAPIDGEGPSDLRVSLLAYYDINKWLNRFVAIRDTASVADTLTKSITP